MTNREIATKIYEKLLEKGAGIGNASILFIEKVLDESIPIEPPVKPANDDFTIIACMYGILQTQEAAIWNKISGKTKEANEMADKLIPQIEKVTQMIENRLSV